MVIFFLFLLYAFWCGGMLWLWKSVPVFHSAAFPQTKITVVVPVRNEEANIGYLLEALAQQNYPKDLWEAIVINDDSTDKTANILEDFQQKGLFQLKICHLPPKIENTSPKKRAIAHALEIATGELIITTDGDCLMGENWLRSIAQYYEKTQAKMISSPITFQEDASIFGKIQIVELASLVGSAACSIFIGEPNMCSGANLAYPKKVFYEVCGFVGNEKLASGDDEFLMHKIAQKYPKDVHFLKSSEAIVYTQTHKSLKAFYQQRKRWASKWRHYQSWKPAILAMFIFGINALCFFGIPIWALAMKFLVEFIFLYVMLGFLGKKNMRLYILPTQLIYPFYVVFFGIVAQGKNNYTWKGRKLQ